MKKVLGFLFVINLIFSEYSCFATEINNSVSGLNKNILKNSIDVSFSNISKRLNNYRSMKFTSKSANYNMPRLKDKYIKYYEDYFTKPYNENNVWLEPFVGNIKQDTIHNIYGYSADYFGASLGYDIRINNNFIIGFGYTGARYGAENNDEKQTRDDLTALTNNFDIYSMLYGKWFYLSLNAGGSYNEIQQKRRIKFNNFDKIAKSDYLGYSYYGKGELGFNILLYSNEKDENKIRVSEKFKSVNENKEDHKFKKYKMGAINDFLLLTPKTNITYGNIMFDKYLEKNADAANMEIKTKDYEFLTVGGGLSITYNKSLNTNWNFQTILGGFINKYLTNDKVELDAKFESRKDIFKLYGFEPSDLNYDGEIQFNFTKNEDLSFGLGYNYRYSKDNTNQLIKLNLLLIF